MHKTLLLVICFSLITASVHAGSNVAIPALVTWMLDEDKAVQVSAGGNHSCAITTSAKVKCWGFNDWGQLGLGRSSSKILSNEAVETKNIKNVIEIDSNLHFNCATLRNGSRKCWGRNQSGQFGNGTRTFSSTPRGVPSQADTTKSSAGLRHFCTLLDTGSIKCWGFNLYGALGNGLPQGANLAVDVVGIDSAIDIDLGDDFSCAVLSSGKVMCWGLNERGQLGDGTLNNSSLPVEVSGIDNAINISVGGSHSCAVLDTGNIKCWGSNFFGQLGNGITRVLNQPLPTQVSGITNAFAIYTGGIHSCAQLSSGQLKCWGRNFRGELGNGDSNGDDSGIPVTVIGVNKPKGVSLGGSHSCAVLDTGDVVCWGSNETVQLGNQSGENSSVPVTVVGF